jgi:putative phosphoribosyl transferase
MRDVPLPTARGGRFHDRVDAGRALAQQLRQYAGRSDVLVLGLPRGGVVVAGEVAEALGLQFDIWLVRKLGVPDQPELALGAISSGDVVYVDERLVRELGIPSDAIQSAVERERRELARRERVYRRGRPAPRIRGRTLLVVDDGIATGSTMRAALVSLQSLSPARIVVAVPVAACEAQGDLADLVDEYVCLASPQPFNAVGAWYDEFAETSDEEVIAWLDRLAPADPGAEPNVRTIELEAGGVPLSGDLALPSRASALVVFAHGSGSSRKSPRNRWVARALGDAGLGTLLLDLLTPEEDAREAAGAQLRFDVERLAQRLVAACDVARTLPECRALPLGLFGASTGAAAALIAATMRPEAVGAVVSRGGRPDLAGPWLHEVLAPTRLIVGGADTEVLALNRQALAQLRCPKDLVIVPGATHLFEEPGALEQVAEATSAWFSSHLRTGGSETHARTQGAR